MNRTTTWQMPADIAATREQMGEHAAHVWTAHSDGHPRHIFDFRARAVLSITVALGVLVAVAPAVPSLVRSQALLVGLGAWTAVVAWGTAWAVRLAGGSLRRDFTTAATVLAVAGIVATVLASTHLEIIRVLYNRPALTWNIDWRFHVNHAQAIARYGGLERALDYAGAAVDYHVGPAWLAGATERVLGRGIYAVSFGLVPLLCVLSTAFAGLYALHVHGIPYRLAAAAAAIALTLPGLGASPRDLYYVLAARDVDVLTNVWAYWSLMLNAGFGIAVGTASLVLMLDRRSRDWQIVLASVGLASLVELKPQFFAGIGLVAGLVGIAYLVSDRGLTRRASRALAACVAALGLGLVLATLLPSSIYASFFAQPAWAPGRTGYALTEPFTNATLLFVFAVAVWCAADLPNSGRRLIGTATVTYIGMAAFPGLGAARVLVLLGLVLSSWLILRRSAPDAIRAYRLPVTIAAGMATLIALFYLVSFPVRADVVARAQLLVEPTFSTHGGQRDLAQSLIPLQLLLVTSAVGLLALRVAHGTPGWQRVFCAAGALSVLSLLALVAFHFARPERGHETAEDLGLLQTLQQVPRDRELLIASDLADPAENYRRPLRAFLLTAYRGHAFYVANLRYVHFIRPDAQRRLAELRAFFGSPWSQWHEEWLRRKGVGYVLVSDRCLPVWYNQPGVPLQSIARHGHWTGYAAHEAKGLEGLAAMPIAHELTPRFGAQGCLAFRETGS